MRPVHFSPFADAPPARAAVSEHGSPALDSLGGLEKMWSLITEQRQPAHVDVNYAILDDLNCEPNWVISTVYVWQGKSAAEITRYPAMLKWLTAGFNRLPEISPTGSAVVC